VLSPQVRVGEASSEAPLSFLARHARFLSWGVLLLAAINLSVRLGQEFVSEWDESLYAISAWETVTHGGWLATTFLGEVDYYNTKPPLFVWLVALCFKTFGVSLLSLRLVPALSAWLTVAVLQRWLWRAVGPRVAILASLALTVTFGFIHIHAGRSAVTDAPFTLVLLLVVVTLWAERESPWRRVWLGPLVATAFLLRGMGVLLPLCVIAGVLLVRRGEVKVAWRPSLAAVAAAIVPVGAWAVARYQVDEWAFLSRLVLHDFVDRAVQPLEGHVGGTFYYLNILLKHQYELTLAALLSLSLVPAPWARLRAWFRTGPQAWGLAPLLGVWAGVTLLVPTLMQTKTPWYLNTFYPVFAVLVALALSQGVEVWRGGTARSARASAVVVACAALLVFAESRLWWYSLHNRDLARSEQALLLADGPSLRGHRLLNATGHRASHFVATALMGADTREVANLAEALKIGAAGDYILSSEGCAGPGLEALRTNDGASLCRRLAVGESVP